jgi:hypothetical protein
MRSVSGGAAMHYESIAEREARLEAAASITWSELVRHVQEVESCDEREARRQINNAINDGALRVRRVEWSKVNGGGPLPPDFWQSCKCDPSDPDRIFFRVFYDPRRVNKWQAQRLNKIRGLGKPFFDREQAMELWSREQDELRSASEVDIHKTIIEVYDRADRQGDKPPNKVQLVSPVQEMLRARGLKASGRQIQNLSDDPQHSSRRREPGLTLASENQSRLSRLPSRLSSSAKS